MLLRGAGRQAGIADIGKPGNRYADDADDDRADLDQEGHVMRVLHGLVVGQDQDRIAPEFLPVMADETVVEGKAGEYRANRQQGQRDQHHHRAFMHMLHHVMVGARRAVEGHEQQAPGIEGREDRGRHAHDIGILPHPAGRIGHLEDHVLGIVAGEDREAGQRQAADPHHHIGGLDVLPQAAHVAHVLLAADGMDHRAGAEEQQGLEEGMGEQVEDRGRIGRDAQREEHVAELRAGRIGDHALDVVLRQADGGGEEGGRGADHGDEGQRVGRVFEQR